MASSKKTQKSAKREFKFIDLFSGIGGFHQALEQLGGVCVLASDIDAECRDVYEKNYKLKPLSDIRAIEAKDVPDHDVLCAGFPCQPFSKGGSQKGFTDQTRGTLFYEIVRIVEVKKPRFLILENVRNIASHDNGNTWKVIIESLHELGYRVSSKPLILAPHNLSPQDGGAPQLRERVVILAERLEFSEKRNESNLELDWSIDFSNYPSPEWDPQMWDFKKWISTHTAVENKLVDYTLTKEDIKILKVWGSFAKVLGKNLTSGFPIWNYAMKSKNNNSGLPDWKVKFHNKNSKLYKENKIVIDKWRASKKIDTFNPSRQKFEWQAQEIGRAHV